MAHQYSDAVRNAQLDAVETTVSTAPSLEVRTGAPPANCAAADSGSVLATIVLPSDWMQNAASGSKQKSVAAWSVAASAGGTAAHYRIKQGATCHIQGTAGQSVVIATNALTAANGNVLNFASTTGVVVGMNVSGTGIPADTTVVALTGTTVTLSRTSTAGVSSAASITFSYDLPLDNAVIAGGQTVTVNTYTLNRGNA